MREKIEKILAEIDDELLTYFGDNMLIKKATEIGGLNE